MTATTEAPPKPVGADDKKPSGLRSIVEWVVILGVTLVATLLIRAFLFQTFYIPSASMVPTLEINDRIIVNRLSYKLHDVHRGDVVVFERPPDDPSPIRDLVKRVVAIPGDTIETRGDTLFVNDRPVKEPYVKTSSIGAAIPRRTIDAGKVFVMGDNRTNSTDSRIFGPIDEDSIVGRAFVKVWPLGAVGLL